MGLHDRIVREFEETRSLAALIYLVEHGREIEFSYEGRPFFLSRSQARRRFSLWRGREEQSFDDLEELIEHAEAAEGRTLLDILPQIQIETIF